MTTHRRLGIGYTNSLKDCPEVVQAIREREFATHCRQATRLSTTARGGGPPSSLTLSARGMADSTALPPFSDQTTARPSRLLGVGGSDRVAFFTYPDPPSKDLDETKYDRSIWRKLEELVDAAPLGSDIDVSAPGWLTEETDLAEALGRARERGCNIRVLTQSCSSCDQWFGMSRKVRESLVAEAISIREFPLNNSVFLNQDVNHNKFILVSKAQDDWIDVANGLVAQTSSNLSHRLTLDLRVPNDLVLIANAGLYAGYRSYFQQMWNAADPTRQSNVYAPSPNPTRSGDFTAYFGPFDTFMPLDVAVSQAFADYGDIYTEAISMQDPILGILARVVCGSMFERTKIRVAAPMGWTWSGSELDRGGRIQRALSILADRGCDVQVLTRYKADRDDAPDPNVLKVPHGHHSAHVKYMLIEGLLGENNVPNWTNLVVTGSANFDGPSFGEMADTHLVIKSSTPMDIFEQYREHWQWLCAQTHKYFDEPDKSRPIRGDLDCSFPPRGLGFGG